MELYDDGVIAESAGSTEITNAFLEHVINWAVESFGLTFDPNLVRQKMHTSELAVQFAPSLAGSLRPLGAFADLLSEKSFNAPPQKCFLSGITFGISTGVSPFSIETRANTPPDANVFYSKAGTDTSTHIQLLTRLEELLSSND